MSDELPETLFGYPIQVTESKPAIITGDITFEDWSLLADITVIMLMHQDWRGYYYRIMRLDGSALPMPSFAARLWHWLTGRDASYTLRRWRTEDGAQTAGIAKWRKLVGKQ